MNVEILGLGTKQDTLNNRFSSSGSMHFMNESNDYEYSSTYLYKRNLMTSPLYALNSNKSNGVHVVSIQLKRRPVKHVLVSKLLATSNWSDPVSELDKL